MLELQDDELYDDFLLIGIKVSEHSLIKFIYQLNKYLNTRFRRLNDLDISHNGKIFYHALFEYNDELNFNHYSIIKNLSFPNTTEPNEFTLFSVHETQYYVLSKYKSFDYLLKINGELIDDWDKNLPLSKLKSITSFHLINELTSKEKQFLYL